MKCYICGYVFKEFGKKGWWKIRVGESYICESCWNKYIKFWETNECLKSFKQVTTIKKNRVIIRRKNMSILGNETEGSRKVREKYGKEIQELAKAIYCLWIEDGNENWETECGNVHISGSHQDKLYKYCPYCGKEIK